MLLLAVPSRNTARTLHLGIPLHFIGRMVLQVSDLLLQGEVADESFFRSVMIVVEVSLSDCGTLVGVNKWLLDFHYEIFKFFKSE